MPSESWGLLTSGLRTSLVVGTVLTAVNQGPMLMASSASEPALFSVLLNYLIPFGVAIHSRWALLREIEGRSLIPGTIVEAGGPQNDV